MRALVVTNMWPSPAKPALGSFVRDQVDALRRVGDEDLEIEVFGFPPGDYLAAARALRRMPRDRPFDVMHAHFGLTAWPALAAPARRRAVTLHGTDVRHPRSGILTRLVLPRLDLVAAVSEGLAAELPRRQRERAVVLPCGVATDRFRPIDQDRARAELGLEAGAPLLLFPADPARPGKRHDRAAALAAQTGAGLLALGGIAPDRVPLWINAADAVIVPFEHEGFGLAVLEALACDVPVLATPTGIHADALEGIDGTLCAPWALARWSETTRDVLARRGTRIAGRERAERWGADAMARRVLDAWHALPASE